MGERGTQASSSTLPLLQVPIPKTGYTNFGTQLVAGGTYISLAKDPNLNFYIVFRITDFPTSGFTMDCVVIYRPS